jgi:hypothetical protein
MASLIDKGVLGNKTSKGFFARDGKTKLALDIASGDYKPVSEIALPNLDYIDEVAHLHSMARYEEGMEIFLSAQGDEADIARKVIAGYISYAFHRVGEVTETITGIDLIMGTGFNWAPPSVLVDAMGPGAAAKMIEDAGLPVPEAISKAATTGEPKLFFTHPQINTGKFFVAA